MAYQGRLSTFKSGSGGSAAYGSVPGQTPLPNPSADLGKVYPNLSQTNTAVSSDILNQLNGELSPDTISNIKDNAASFGVSSGMPGSQFSSYRGLRNLGIASQDLQQQGIQNYNSTLPTVSNTQTVRPETQIALDQSNKVLASSPDPVAAAAEQQRLFDSYMAKLAASKASPYAATQGQNYALTKLGKFDLTSPQGVQQYNSFRAAGSV